MSEAQPALMEALNARGIVREWVKGAQTLAVLEAVHRLGWLERLRRPVPLSTLTSADWSRQRVRGVIDVLSEAAVVTETPDGWQLTTPFAALLAGASGVSLDSVLASVRLDLAALAKLDQEPTTILDAEAALIVARDSGRGRPVTLALYRSVYAAMPEVEAVLESKGPLLDLGSGIGGACSPPPSSTRT